MAVVSPRAWNPGGETYYQLNWVLTRVADHQDASKVRVRFIDNPDNDVVFDTAAFDAAYAAYVNSL